MTQKTKNFELFLSKFGANIRIALKYSDTLLRSEVRFVGTSKIHDRGKKPLFHISSKLQDERIRKLGRNEKR